MRTLPLLFTLGLSLIPSIAQADTYVRGYYRKDRTYVRPHYRSSPNGTVLDNWSTEGNINPYTGEHGRLNPYPYRTNLFNSNSVPTTSRTRVNITPLPPIVMPGGYSLKPLNNDCFLASTNNNLEFRSNGGVESTRLRQLQEQIQCLQNKYRTEQYNNK